MRPILPAGVNRERRVQERPFTAESLPEHGGQIASTLCQSSYYCASRGAIAREIALFPKLFSPDWVIEVASVKDILSETLVTGMDWVGGAWRCDHREEQGGD